jgi:glycosyltransferase involved in cell wall biosynthesis
MTENNTNNKSTLSIVLPSCNEAESLKDLLPAVKSKYPDAEIIVVNDGSTDKTVEICKKNKIKIISHKLRKGNGAAIKSGARGASGDFIVFMDADGQHKPEDIKLLIAELDKDYDMVVGARDASSQASMGRKLANGFYNKFASYMVGHKIEDLTSGFRAVKASKFREYLFLLPNGFSYPSSITMAFFRAGYSIKYVPIVLPKRKGVSHISPVKDGIRFLLIIFKVGTLYSPLKIFFPISFMHFFLGIGYYAYTYLTAGRFTNMSALLFITAVIIFLIGLVSEQITNLMYSDK